jgi:hypothetical protein
MILQIYTTLSGASSRKMETEEGRRKRLKKMKEKQERGTGVQDLTLSQYLRILPQPLISWFSNGPSDIHSSLEGGVRHGR